MSTNDERIDIGEVVNASLNAFQVEQLRLENAFLRQRLDHIARRLEEQQRKEQATHSKACRCSLCTTMALTA